MSNMTRSEGSGMFVGDARGSELIHFTTVEHPPKGVMEPKDRVWLGTGCGEPGVPSNTAGLSSTDSL